MAGRGAVRVKAATGLRERVSTAVAAAVGMPCAYLNPYRHVVPCTAVHNRDMFMYMDVSSERKAHRGVPCTCFKAA